ncbi:glycosyltransferase involved in cell wall biosynthesis [Roseinatronobacter thiooxidans]|uniref:Glycosyltransferase involved in cell wall biosynthesis n=1 Tax=Roseinatronobacter thiooxidans TaxID=121821 RepID=A0A2W7QHD9_9RHOB|nr:glycosyltransferase family 4 protein [Roseinatronobacter thiooxidans]PZX40639.1 glycosyltransferase involved in cell wall biosynthesis [Roseinatronobacter thiooxidans]
MTARILLTGNTCFKIANFREGLVRTLIARGFEVVVLAPTDPTREKLIAMGCRVIDLPMDRNGTAPLAELALLGRLYRVLRRERPAFVFGYTIKNNIYSGLVCRWLGIAFVPNVTGLGPAFNDAGALNRIIRLLYRLAFARARCVFFQNPEDQAIFLQAGLIAPDRSQLLPGSGVDLARFAARPLPEAGQGIVFLLVARLLWDKGVGLFADAARVMRARDPSLRFQVLGSIDRSSRSAVPLEQVQAWHKEGVIEYLGETSDVRPALEAAHCVVLPTWYREGTPRVLLEAAALGRPAITTDTPGCRDAVLDGETGYLCVPRSVEALIAALECFVSMPASARADMARRARARAEAEFDEAQVIAAYTSLLPQ